LPWGDNVDLSEFATSIKDKGVLITGAGRGIGKRLAMGLAKSGARVGLLARSQPELDVAKLEIEHAGGVTLRIRADVTDFEQMCAAVDRMQVMFGGTHVLICSAGALGPIGPFLGARMKDWRHAIDTNLIGVAHACRAVLPSMIERRSGKIIAIVGGGSSTPRPYVTAHAAAKAGVVRFIESLAEEVRDYNVQLNCLDPGNSYTAMTDEILRCEELAGTREMEEAQRVRITGGTSPEKQVQMALFLASPHSNHISGRLLSATDDYKKLHHQNMHNDAYTLRRQVKG
jgi:NAD(P)-dependent dehydrogenase (short-subunit alcohol dehydrogenase family)